MGEQEVVINQDKPYGTLQKLLDISLLKSLGWKPNIALKNGTRSVYKWYLKGINLKKLAKLSH